MTVHPGDIVVGDADGVVVIPRSKEEEVLKKSLKKVRQDEQRAEKVSGNQDEIIAYLDNMLG